MVIIDNLISTGEEVIFLDPHTTQRSGSVDTKCAEGETEIDASYHCRSASRIPITGIDPSVALVGRDFFFFQINFPQFKRQKIFHFQSCKFFFIIIHFL